MRFPSPLKSLIVAAAASPLLTACSPHPGAGNWQAADDNRYGIEKLAIEFDGKAEFSTKQPEAADMHCFWGATAKSTVALQCTPSTNPDHEQHYRLTVDESGVAEFSHGDHVVGRFKRVEMQ